MLTNIGRVIRRSLWALGLLVFCALFLVLPEARADHSIQKSCITCHSLRSGKIVPCSRNVLADNIADPLYGVDDWPCGSAGWDACADEPLDCSYCHYADVAGEFKAANGGKLNTSSSSGSAHPVDVVADTFSYPGATRIFCNDCHDGNSHTITPNSLCLKTDIDGYPNHKNTVVNGINPGTNDLASNPPSLTAPYGTSVDWTDPTFAYDDVLCFICHDGDNSTRTPYAYTNGFVETSMTSGRLGGPMEDILDSYNASHGGHNVLGLGLDGGTGVTAQKLPCYECHDPHASADPEGGVIYNDGLISSAGAFGTEIVNPYDPLDLDPSEDSFTFNGYNRSAAKEVELCMTCHQSGTGAAELEDDKRAVELEHPISSGNLAFGFHAAVHVDASGGSYAGGCLQRPGEEGVGGCHYSPHNNSPYECLECHTDSARGNNTILDAVAHVGSEFGLLSQHDIPYTSDPTQPNYADRDMSLKSNNGCLSCHDVPGSDPGELLAVDGSVYSVSLVSDREGLNNYNGFCEGCHDGSLDAGEVFDGLKPPNVSKYYSVAGHGMSTDLDSGNPAPKVGCLECHLYHGSTAYKLLPGPTQTADYDATTDPDSGGRVVKGFSYTGSAATETIGTRYTIGGVPNSTHIDYIDYTVEDRHNTTGDNKERMAVKYSNYTTSEAWDTYYDNTGNTTRPSDPTGTQVFFGTSGDRVDQLSRVACGDVLNPPTVPSEPVGFCDTCHIYSDTTDGTDTTFNAMRTHAGFVEADMADCDDKPNYKDVSVNFQKDCTECHDPHGSGYDGTENANWYMVRGKIVTSDDGANIETFNVVFGDTGSDGIFKNADSFDEADSENGDDICAVCHFVNGTVGADHNRSDYTSSTPGKLNHNVGNNCLPCHPHIDRFMLGAGGACNGCHGYPPEDAGTTGATPPDENYPGGGLPHRVHVDFLAQTLNLPLPLTDNFPTKEVCGPCHGDGAGSDNHNTSDNSVGAWPLTARPHINIEERDENAATGTFPSTTSWGANPEYGDLVLPVGVPNTNQIPADDMDLVDSRCSNIDCHGSFEGQDELMAPYNRRSGNQEDLKPKVSWYQPNYIALTATGSDTPGVGSPSDGLEESEICQTCHNALSAQIRIYNDLNQLVYGPRNSNATMEYVSTAVDAGANYFGTLSDHGPTANSSYGYGGHGDERISSDPEEVPSSTLSAPIDCTACHDPDAAHFRSLDSGTDNDAVAASASARLFEPVVLEDSTHSANGLCNSTNCHVGANYPGTDPDWRHHPSYVDYVWPLQPITQNVTVSTTWTDTGGALYEQNHYGAGSQVVSGSTTHVFSGNIDRFLDWYDRDSAWIPGTVEDHNQTSPRGVFLYENGAATTGLPPRATLPLSQYTPDTGAAGKVLCVTCHNPHGSDLYVHDPLGVAGDIPDHNMLRLFDDDNTLCNGCH